MKYQVMVQKTGYMTGCVEIEAGSPDDAISKVDVLIKKDQHEVDCLVSWSDFIEESDSFSEIYIETTGDVD